MMVENAIRDLVREVVRAELQDQSAAVAQPPRGHELLTATAAAEIANVHVWTVRQWIKRGVLPASRIGRSYRVRLVDLETSMREGSLSTRRTERAAPPPGERAAAILSRQRRRRRGVDTARRSVA